MILLQFVLGLLVILVLSVLVSSVVKKATVFEFEKGLHFHQGHFVKVLPAGQYWYLPLLTRIDKVDMRRRTVTIPGQEVFTADSAMLKISLAVIYHVGDPMMSSLYVVDPEQAMYTVLQLALRDLVAKAKADELIEKRGELGARLLEAVEPQIRELGLALDTLGVKDFMFPGDLKRAFAQVVRAQKEGLAALERARGEAAALRSLANAAKLLENNPALVQLRLIQSLDETRNNSLVWGMSQGSAPVVVPKPQEGGAR